MEDSKSGDKITLTKDNVQLAFRNIHNALNKSSLKGVFDLKESAQLCNDLTIFGQIVEHVCKTLS
jgi:hypothetical protein